MIKKDFEKHLKEEHIPFWLGMVDRERGGLYGCMDREGHILKSADKGTLLQSRSLWYFSTAADLTGDPALREAADRVYRFFRDHCIDPEYGGVVWTVSPEGRIKDDSKDTYNQGFAIYALSAYYGLTGKEKALSIARELYTLVERCFRDRDGYLEAFNRDLTPRSNERLSENGVLADRTMNTLLHIMEGYTELYRVSGDEAVRSSLLEILDIFRTRVFDPERRMQKVFFDFDYHSLIDLISYGHDIETAWLVDRTLEVIGEREGEEDLLASVRHITDVLAEAVYERAYDEASGSLDNECEKGLVNKNRIWWVQAEAVTGFYNAYGKHPEETRYREASERIFAYIEKNLIDPSVGEWYEEVRPGNEVYKDKGYVHLWKCPYHNGRMYLEMLKRLPE